MVEVEAGRAERLMHCGQELDFGTKMVSPLDFTATVETPVPLQMVQSVYQRGVFFVMKEMMSVDSDSDSDSEEEDEQLGE